MSIKEKLRQEEQRLKKEFQEKVAGYILAAFGLVAGLAWNEAIKSFIDLFFPYPRNDVLIKFIYAGIVTVVIVLVSVYLLRPGENKEVKK